LPTESEVHEVGSLDKTMQFHFPEEPLEKEVREVIFHVFQALEEKDTIRSTKSSATYYQGIPPISRGIRTPETSSGNWSGMKSSKSW